MKVRGGCANTLRHHPIQRSLHGKRLGHLRHSLLDDGPLGWMLGGASIFLTAIGCQILLETLCGGM